MSLPPRNSDRPPLKRPRAFPTPPVPVEEEEDDFSDDDEDDFSDVSANAEGGDEEEDDDDVVEVIGVARRSVSSSSSSPSSSSSSQLSVTLKSSELDCPTCLEPLKGPIYQCRNGHITCSPCLPRVYKQCPVCRIPIGDIRCRALEKLIEASTVPCTNAVYGCKQTSSYGNEWEHEKVCVFIRIRCPLPNCYYMGAYKDLQAHARVTHSWDVENLIPFVFDTPQIFSMNLARKTTALFQEENEGDLVVVQAVKGRHGGVCVTVSCIAPLSRGIRSLSCSLAKLNAYTTLRIGLMVRKIQSVMEPEEPEEDFLFIPDYMLSDDHLKMQICVGNELKYAHI